MTIHSPDPYHKTLAPVKDEKAMKFIEPKVQGNQNSQMTDTCKHTPTIQPNLRHLSKQTLPNYTYLIEKHNNETHMYHPITKERIYAIHILSTQT